MNEQRGEIQLAVDRRLATKADLKVVDSQIFETKNGLSALQDRKNALKLQKLKSDQVLADLKSKAAVVRLSMSEIDTGLLRLEQTLPTEAIRRESEIQANKEILENLRRRHDDLRFVKAPFSGTVIELPIGIGQAIGVGEVVATLSKTPTAGEQEPLRVTAFFPIALGKQVSADDAAFITPTTIQRERYGSILGTVDHVYALPISVEEAVQVVGNREVLRPLFNRGGLLGIHATLRKGEDGEISWTSENSPSPPTAGTTVAIRVVVERRKPISYLLPFMNRAVFGTESKDASEFGGS